MKEPVVLPIANASTSYIQRSATAIGLNAMECAVTTFGVTSLEK